MTVDSISLGDLTITRLLDGWFEADAGILTHRRHEAARLAAIKALGAPRIRVPINAFLLRRGETAILVDAGAGAVWGPAYGGARAALAAQGMAPEAVSHVLLTHLHGDHGLGLIEDGRPFFANAAVIAPTQDLAFFSDQEARARLPVARQGGFALTEQLRAVLGDRLAAVEPGPVLEGVALEPYPGHTPGHAGYRIAAGGAEALLWGDVLHVGALQPADPDIGLAFDLDGAVAAETRRACLEALAGKDTIVGGGHIDGFFRVARVGGGYALRPPDESPHAR